MTDVRNRAATEATEFPSTDEYLGWIQQLTALGHRKTGTPEGRAAAELIARELTSFGLERVQLETAPTPCPTVHDLRLSFDGHDHDTYWVNGTGRSAELGRFRHDLDDVEVIHLGLGLPEDFDGADVAGKLVVCDIAFHPLSSPLALDLNDRMEIYDPGDTFEVERRKFDIYSPNNWPTNYFLAQEGGAAGFVGVLRDYMDHQYYNEDYTESGAAMGVDRMRIPAAWVSRASGADVRAAYDEDGASLTASLSLDVEYTLREAINVSGVLPGDSEDIILVHSHHDAVFAGGVQDASGVSEVLALAKHFARVPREQRAATLMFATTDTHFTDYVGHDAFIEARANARDNIVLDVCLEHIAREVELDDDNNAVDTGLPEPRLVYVSDESGLLDDVRVAFHRYELTRTLFMPVQHTPRADNDVYEFQRDEVISDAYPFASIGIPVVSLVSGPMYLFHPSDTIDRVAVDQLRPVGIAFAEIIDAAAGRMVPRG